MKNNMNIDRAREPMGELGERSLAGGGGGI
jgi:hypothetical protein